MRSAALLLLSGCVASLHPTAHATLSDGATASDFDLPAQDGSHVTLAGARARGPVVLVFYRGYW